MSVLNPPGEVAQPIPELDAVAPEVLVAARRRRRRGQPVTARHLRSNKTAYLMIAPMVILLASSCSGRSPIRFI
jgi:hypothetical protein